MTVNLPVEVKVKRGLSTGVKTRGAGDDRQCTHAMDDPIDQRLTRAGQVEAPEPGQGKFAFVVNTLFDDVADRFAVWHFIEICRR